MSPVTDVLFGNFEASLEGTVDMCIFFETERFLSLKLHKFTLFLLFKQNLWAEEEYNYVDLTFL